MSAVMADTQGREQQQQRRYAHRKQKDQIVQLQERRCVQHFEIPSFAYRRRAVRHRSTIASEQK
jgi:hypothetical protein